MKTCFLSELPDPAPTRFVDPIAMTYPTAPMHDESWFEDLHTIVSAENVQPCDKVMMGMLASLGIEKGRPYEPDTKTRTAMRQAVVDAYHHLMRRFLHPDDPSRRW
jgi:hypothetical protein